MHPTIAFLATGDEIIEGDVVNTSTPAIANLLKPLGVKFGTQMASDDEQDNIENALHYLLKDHAAIIITGGLGPTCDDRTRFAVANVADKELVLDKESWDRVYSYIYNLRGFVPTNNKQQCLFPSGSTPLKNDYGTADGCHIIIDAKNPDRVHSKQQHIFMLPGPPSQALPIVEKYLLPFFKQGNFSQESFRHSWMLKSTSEGHLAEQIEHALGEEHHGIQIGYRYAPPYLQVKLQADSQKLFDRAYQTILPILAPFVWKDGSNDAIALLLKLIQSNSDTWYFEDFMTQGYLNKALVHLNTLDKVSFAPNKPSSKPDYHIALHIIDLPRTEATAIQTKKLELTWQLSLITPHGEIKESFESSLTHNDHSFNTLSHLIVIEILRLITIMREKNTTQ